jgi:hypothetical protein
MSFNSLTDALAQLLNEEQRLHRALVTADSPAIFESVKAISSVLPQLEKADGSTLKGAELERARELAQRIRLFQAINHEISNGTLRTLRVCTELLTGNSYEAAKAPRVENQSNLNVSA